jgi:hypothetical protein
LPVAGSTAVMCAFALPCLPVLDRATSNTGYSTPVRTQRNAQPQLLLLLCSARCVWRVRYR